MGNTDNVPKLIVGTTVPSSCKTGSELFFKSDAEAGSNLYVCYNGTFVLTVNNIGTTPMGPAGGALAGEYPNPTLSPGISAALIADGTVNNTQFQLLGTATTASTPGTLVLRDSEGKIPGTISSLEWSAVTNKPDSWLNNSNLVRTINNVNTAMPSGFYDGNNMTNAPFTGWGSVLNVRYTSDIDNNGFQLASAHGVTELWYRDTGGGSGNWYRVALAGSGAVYNLSISGNALTATALATDPTDCDSGKFATGIAASGNLTCASIAASDLPTHNHSASDINSGTMSVTRGGTGLSSITSGKMLYASSNNVLSALTVGSTLNISGATLNVTDNSNTQKGEVWNNGIKVGTRKAINFIPGTNISYSIADNGAGDRVDVTINSASFIGGSGAANQVAIFNGNDTLTSSSGLVFTSNMLGIGISSPTTSLDVNGDARIASRFRFNSPVANGGHSAIIALDDNVGTGKMIDFYNYTERGLLMRIHGDTGAVNIGGWNSWNTNPGANNLAVGGNVLVAGYIHSNTSAESHTISNFITDSGDGYFRKSSLAAASTAIFNAQTYDASWTWNDDYISLPINTVQWGVFTPRVGPATITSVWCWSDDANTTIALVRSDGNEMMSPLACKPASTTSLNTYANIPVNYSVGMVKKAGTAKRISVGITYTTAY